MNTSEYLVKEYDLEKVIWDIQHRILFEVAHKWVRGHQNQDKQGNTIYGPFQCEAQLNIEMDLKANLGNKLKPGLRQVYKHTKIVF